MNSERTQAIGTVEPMNADEIKQRILGALDDYRDAGPEKGESWRSWYCAAFDLASEKIAGLLDQLAAPATPAVVFQQRVQPWMTACFGVEISRDIVERNHRFLEEALELVQSTGCTASEAHQLVEYVYGRPAGEKHQEIGGVMVTLAALCLALGEDMHVAGETELARIWSKVEKIRAKQAAKPKHSPLPEHLAPNIGASVKEAVDDGRAVLAEPASPVAAMCEVSAPGDADPQSPSNPQATG